MPALPRSQSSASHCGRGVRPKRLHVQVGRLLQWCPAFSGGLKIKQSLARDVRHCVS